MHYELYIDIWFLVNFLMDICILLISWKILKCHATYTSICIGAMTGAFFTCIIIVLPIRCFIVKFVLFHGLVPALMIRSGLKVRWGKEFIKAYVIIWISVVLMGGVLGILEGYIREFRMFLILAFISYLCVLGVWNYIAYVGRCENTCCIATLYQGEKETSVNAIIDTGNRLRDSITGKPVSIISKNEAEKLWKNLSINNLRYIPYHTVGKKEGVLPMIKLEKLCLHLEKEVWIKDTYVAISEELSSEEEYGMIINPDIK